MVLLTQRTNVSLIKNQTKNCFYIVAFALIAVFMVRRETGIAREFVVLLYLVSAPVLCQHLYENICPARCCPPRLENTLGA